ncbi:MAG: WG repeat-containing protein [Bacteroidia bacterium]|nr:WG repeat-containing protein [Bacteroidia bacterium]
MKTFILLSTAILISPFSWSQTIKESHQEKYDEIGTFGLNHDDWALVKKDNRLGFIDIKGNEVVPLKFKQLEDLKKWLDDEINKP